MLAQKPIWLQTARTVVQLPGPIRTKPFDPVASPANTTATTPEAPSHWSAIR